MIEFVRFDHLLISIPEGTKEAARKFYAEGLQLMEIPGEHPRGAMWFSMGDIELHVREENSHDQASARHPAFEVRDLPAAKAFLQNQDIQVSYSSEIEGRDRCFFRDPWGNRFELIEFKG